MIDAKQQAKWYKAARAERWQLAPAVFATALAASLDKGLGANPSRAETERYLSALHVEELALACACAEGNDAAWEHFVLTYRPQLYRSADAIDPGGGAREIADALYGELFGLRESGGERRSLLRYFHGRSSLATWLRAVLSQRFVDRVRERARSQPLPDEESAEAIAATPVIPDPDRARFVSLMQTALMTALALVTDVERLRLACYYARQMTLAQIGRLLGEHESTVSRQLARTRTSLRASVEQWLASEAGLNEDEIAACFASMADDAGPLNLVEMFGGLAGAGNEPLDVSRKNSQVDRSNEGRLS